MKGSGFGAFFLLRDQFKVFFPLIKRAHTRRIKGFIQETKNHVRTRAGWHVFEQYYFGEKFVREYFLFEQLFMMIFR